MSFHQEAGWGFIQVGLLRRVSFLKVKPESSTTCECLLTGVLSLMLTLRSFFAGCHLFIPLFDPNYDTFESLMERTPWTFDSILAIASKIRSGNAPLSPTFYKCLEEAQGIARSSLFGPVVRKEAVMGKQFRTRGFECLM